MSDFMDTRTNSKVLSIRQHETKGYRSQIEPHTILGLDNSDDSGLSESPASNSVLDDMSLAVKSSASRSKFEHDGLENYLVPAYPSYDHNPYKPAYLIANKAFEAKLAEQGLFALADHCGSSALLSIHGAGCELNESMNRSDKTVASLQPSDGQFPKSHAIAYDDRKRHNLDAGGWMPQANARADSNILNANATSASLAIQFEQSQPDSDTDHIETIRSSREEIADNLFLALRKGLEDDWGIKGSKAEEASELCVNVYAAMFPRDFDALHVPIPRVLSELS